MSDAKRIEQSAKHKAVGERNTEHGTRNTKPFPGNQPGRNTNEKNMGPQKAQKTQK